ncbi:hypothetical protein L227DRAFT_50363 [Lentinus tigrinus ALCF2SS1-6]|uniref:Mediator complex subunit Med13 N-terminal domain-containing protein n=1 Tax=Lentinus tigrinus ALCF2SS1-6 TaxID=1328759 RepID=A0A5C2SG01_9APHY|nr:hypothetical protein L227DRAFT_50363 [Lentinus tigrinus ALCF2SS1-6]
MAAKAQQPPQDNTGSSVLSQTPLAISLASSILASTISLPEHPLVVYAVFRCQPSSTDPLEQLDVARQAVLARNEGRSLVDSLLPVVHVSKDAAALYVFALGSTERRLPVHDTLFSLDLEYLSGESFYPTPRILRVGVETMLLMRVIQVMTIFRKCKGSCSPSRNALPSGLTLVAIVFLHTRPPSTSSGHRSMLLLPSIGHHPPHVSRVVNWA